MKKNKKNGYLNEQTTNDCNNCYYYHSNNIFFKTIFFKMPVTLTGKNNKAYFEALYNVRVSKLNANTKIIEFGNNLSGNVDWVYITRNNGSLYLVKKKSYSNSPYQLKDRFGGNYAVPASYICIQKSKKK